MNIKIPKIFNVNTPEGEELTRQIEEFLFKVKKGIDKDPIFINGVPYTILCGKPPNTTVFHIMNKDQLKEWNDPNIYLRPYAQPIGVTSFQSIDLRNKRTRRRCAEEICFHWNYKVKMRRLHKSVCIL